MDNRDLKIMGFLDRSGWSRAVRKPLAGDASGRRYERLLLPATGRTAVLMDVPSDLDSSSVRFVQLAGHLTALGFSAPKILAEDARNGLLLLEDLGDSLFSHIVAKDTKEEVHLYGVATDMLLALHQYDLPKVSYYGPVEMADKIDLAFDWYQNGAAGPSDTELVAEIATQLLNKLTAHEGRKKVLVLRDFHADNLIWLPDRQGVARVGLLDFQDAVAGHPAYDLVSILQDARRDVSPDTEALMIDRYVAASGFDSDEFRLSYALQGLQRNLRILGVFARLAAVSGKPAYIDLIPRVWRLLQTNLRHPDLADLALLIGKSLAEPTADVLQRLRLQ